MKTFEERLTAWIDGHLQGAELAAFEKELDGHPEAESERLEAQRLGDLLRRHTVAPKLGNEEFFNLQLMEKIAAEERAPGRPAGARSFSFRWALPHLAWAGACSLILSFALYKSWVMPSQIEQNAALTASRALPTPFEGAILPAKYDARVLQAQPGDPNISATALPAKKDGVTVLWLDGLDYLSSDKDLQ
jgi:anti-sigma factor RsiW